MFKIPSVHNSRASEINISEIPNSINPCFQKYNFLPMFQRSRNAVFRNGGIRNSSCSEIQILINPPFRIFRFGEMQMCWNAHLRKFNHSENQLLRNPDSQKYRTRKSTIVAIHVYSKIDLNKIYKSKDIKRLRFFQNPCWQNTTFQLIALVWKSRTKS